MSVRMLRHYDAIGLLSPETNDRSVQRIPLLPHRAAAAKLEPHIVALKELGPRLDQVQDIVDERLDSGERICAGCCGLRQAEIESQILESEQRASAGPGASSTHRSGADHVLP